MALGDFTGVDRGVWPCLFFIGVVAGLLPFSFEGVVWRLEFFDLALGLGEVKLITGESVEAARRDAFEGVLRIVLLAVIGCRAGEVSGDVMDVILGRGREGEANRLFSSSSSVFASCGGCEGDLICKEYVRVVATEPASEEPVVDALATRAGGVGDTGPDFVESAFDTGATGADILFVRAGIDDDNLLEMEDASGTGVAFGEREVDPTVLVLVLLLGLIVVAPLVIDAMESARRFVKDTEDLELVDTERRVDDSEGGGRDFVAISCTAESQKLSASVALPYPLV